MGVRKMGNYHAVIKEFRHLLNGLLLVRSGYTVLERDKYSKTIITGHIERRKKGMRQSAVSGAPIARSRNLRNYERGESSREMQTQLQPVIKVPLSTIICKYFYVLLI